MSLVSIAKLRARMASDVDQFTTLSSSLRVVAVSREMLDTGTTLSELESVVNWSTSLAIRALSFAMETRDTTENGVHVPQPVEDLDRVWKTPHAKSENWIRREWVYAC